MSGQTADLLIEIGTEELPPKALRGLMTAFAENVARGLTTERLANSGIRPLASPRRLALLVSGLVLKQEDQEVEHKGPPVRVAFDKNGKPTPAAEAFARKVGVSVDELGRSESEKGEWLSHSAVQPGVSAASLLPGIVEAALAELPIPRPMRWGAHEAEFVRPVHWVIVLHGTQLVDGTVLGLPIGNTTHGHRFMAPEPLLLESSSDYEQRLEEEGFVVADFAERRGRVETGVASAARAVNGSAVSSDELFDEVTALVEWPVPITGRFSEDFLNLPREVIVATLTSHQRYFPIEDDNGALLPAFITLANLESKNPDQVREGNERVIQPRLADAAFFWDADRNASLSDRIGQLDRVVYQKGLGSVGDKSARVAALAGSMATKLGADAGAAERAAVLAKCDLVTGVVGEFPELQGTMGRYYALADGEAPEVADAIGQHYQPRFAGDEIPQGVLGKIVAVADRIDTLCGIFALGKKPSGNRDPFGLRRAALGVVRILVEGELDIDLPAVVEASLAAQPASGSEDTAERVYDYVVERMRAYCLEMDGISAEMFEAVRVRKPRSLVDFASRLNAVAAFVALESSPSLSAANKRIGNILRKAGHAGGREPDAGLFAEDAERRLFDGLSDAVAEVEPLLAERSYTQALARLAELREPVDRFFDDVMVMAEDDTVRLNRLSLLAALREQFLNVADISQLSIK